ncbi:hypothetical protein RRG08_001870 [Elysia crispata]|uniref:Uncharacterized protein n=1 Tax=Elysia crispata TaxID=231223 RepID=A0AAE1DSK7_9GAST|nr:hypothetical protein RRG08_001870 [Elysia crispata]
MSRHACSLSLYEVIDASLPTGVQREGGKLWRPRHPAGQQTTGHNGRLAEYSLALSAGTCQGGDSDSEDGDQWSVLVSLSKERLPGVLGGSVRQSQRKARNIEWGNQHTPVGENKEHCEN